MKKTLLFIAGFASVMYVNAQGTWKALGTEAAVAASTEISLGIANLKCMHSDAATVTGKSDTGAETVSYNGVTYDNPAFIQGSTNGMYFAFLPAKSGTLDIAIKMGSAKKTFAVELTDALWTSLSTTSGNLAALTTGLGTADGITGTASYFATPSVYDTYNKKSGIWDGSTAIQSTGGNVYMVMSIPVTANKTYVVGCFGSKLMLRGVTLATTTNTSKDISDISGSLIFPNPASGKVFIHVNDPTEIGIYNLTGSLVKQQMVTSSQNVINISDLHSGLYFVKTLRNNSLTEKLIIR